MKRIVPAALDFLLAGVVILLIYGCASQPASPASHTTTIMPATPSASSYTDNSGSEAAFDLLSKTQSAMKSVRSYHFHLNNPSILRGEADSPGRKLLEKYIQTEGDVTPPIARYSGEPTTLIVGKDKYVHAPGLDAYFLFEGGQDTFVFNGGLNNPEEFLTVTQGADCAGILGEEMIEGANTIHLRFLFKPKESPGPNPIFGPAEARDVWIEAETYYLRQIEVLQLWVNGSCAEMLSPGEVALDLAPYSSGQLRFSRFNVPISPPIDKPTNVIKAPAYTPSGDWQGTP